MVKKINKNNLSEIFCSKKNLVVLIGGIIFGLGLAFSGAAIPSVALDFLELKNFGLVLILGIAIIISSITFNLAPKFLKKPLIENKFEKKDFVFSKELVIGSVLFGIGWGLTGICPGTILTGLGMGNFILLPGFFSILFGAYLFALYKENFK